VPPQHRVRSNSILPARREPITLTTADGLSLVGEIALPLDHDPVATMLCLHPLPTHGGMMDSQIFRKAAARLPALAQLAVVRFNTRGTSSVQGTSEGVFDGGVAERFDVAAAVEYVEFAELPQCWVVGWSFGTDLALRYGNEPSVVGAVLLSPPLKTATEEDLAGWAASGKPVVAIVPEYDDYLRPDQAHRRFAAIPQAEIIAVPDGKHLWVGQADIVLDLIVQHLNPAAAPLPTTWDGDIAHEPPQVLGRRPD
jgi:alpha/beta superfamily hydrolase